MRSDADMQNNDILPTMISKKSYSIWVTVIIFSSVFILISSTHAGEIGISKDYPSVFRFGVLNLLAKVNHKDAQVAIEMNFVKQNQKQFPGIKAKLEILTDVDNAALMFQQKRLHGISLTGIDYLALREIVPIVPLFISSRQDKPLEAYVLLALKSVENIDQLIRQPERRLVMENLGEKHVGQVWLDNILWEKGYGESKSIFTAIRKADKPARMVLPVFFGQADVCLVPESAFSAMAELNPQIGERLKVLMRSPDFVRSVHCTSPTLNVDLVEAMKRNAVSMGQSVDGQQLMMIFQFKRQFLYDPAYLQGTERIFRKYKKRLAKQYPDRKTIGKK